MAKVTQKEKKKVVKISQLQVINEHAAGIDVADTEMAVAYPTGENKLEIQTFGCFTRDLQDIVKCLKKSNVNTVAMESTGVYWVPLFLLLQENGFETYPVNAKHVKNVTGRKDDEGDAEWIQKLHSCGLLQASIQPDNQTRTLRGIMRHRGNLVRTAATYLNRMQKAYEPMNIKLHAVISDIDGKTGTLITEAIISGERNPEVLAEMRDKRIKASKEDIVKSLEGYWTEEHLFELEQCYNLYQAHRKMIHDCDKKIEEQLQIQIAQKTDGETIEFPKSRKRTSDKHKTSFNTKEYLKEILDTDLLEVFGIGELTALTIFSEVGSDMGKWKNEHCFTAWLGLAPNTKISGGKVISSRIMKKKHHAGQAFRLAANSMYRAQNPLGDFYRRIKARSGPGKAVVATARKLAIIYYKMVSEKESFNPELLIAYQERHKEQKINQLKKKLAKLEAA